VRGEVIEVEIVRPKITKSFRLGDYISMSMDASIGDIMSMWNKAPVTHGIRPWFPRMSVSRLAVVMPDFIRRDRDMLDGLKLFREGAELYVETGKGNVSLRPFLASHVDDEFTAKHSERMAVWRRKRLSDMKEYLAIKEEGGKNDSMESVLPIAMVMSATLKTTREGWNTIEGDFSFRGLSMTRMIRKEMEKFNKWTS